MQQQTQKQTQQGIHQLEWCGRIGSRWPGSLPHSRWLQTLRGCDLLSAGWGEDSGGGGGYKNLNNCPLHVSAD